MLQKDASWQPLGRPRLSFKGDSSICKYEIKALIRERVSILFFRMSASERCVHAITTLAKHLFGLLNFAAVLVEAAISASSCGIEKRYNVGCHAAPAAADVQNTGAGLHSLFHHQVDDCHSLDSKNSEILTIGHDAVCTLCACLLQQKASAPAAYVITPIRHHSFGALQARSVLEATVRAAYASRCVEGL